MTAQLDRKTYLGGSDIGAVLGVSKWKTPLDVWLAKTGQVEPAAPDPARSRILRRGVLMEPVVVEMLREEKGLAIVERNRRYVDPEHAFFAAEIDAEAEEAGERINVEIKTSHPFAAKEWGEEGTDEIDVAYFAQAMWGLMVTGRARTIFGVLIGSDNLLTYEVRRDDETIAEMRARALRFWQHNVLGLVPPDPQTLLDVHRLFGRRAASQIEATPEILAAVRELDQLRTSARQIGEEVDALQFKIGSFMLGAPAMEAKDKPGKHLLTTGGRELMTVALQTQTRIDANILREQFPEIAEKCERKSIFYTFRLKRSKTQ